MEKANVPVVVEPATPPLDSRIFPTCELLNETAKEPSQDLTTSSSSAEKLISLLSKLPYEIRLNIYELCIPCMRHRKRRVRLDYIADCKWMATSPSIFDEAAPLVLANSVLFIYTRLDEHENLVHVFDKHVKHAFPKDSHWVLPAARSMVEKFAITILDSQFYSNRPSLEHRTVEYFANVEAFGNLKTLYISLSPNFVSTWPFDPLQISGAWDGEIAKSIVQTLERVAISLRQVVVLPKTCEVVWRFDRAAVPNISVSLISERKKVLKYLEAMNAAMGKIWRDLDAIDEV